MYILQEREFSVRKCILNGKNYVDFNDGVWYNSYCKCKLCYPMCECKLEELMIKFKIKLKNWYFHGGVDKVAAFLLGVALGKKSSLIAIISVATLIPYYYKGYKISKLLDR